MADIKKIRKAMETAQELYAILLGAQSDLATVQAAAAEAKAAAETEHNRIIAEEQAKVAEAQRAMEVADKNLEDFEAKTKEQLNIEVNLAPKTSGGQTRL